MTHLRYPLFVAAVLAASAASAEPCKLTAIGNVEVVAVRDGRTLALREGGEVRLAGIEAPEGAQGAAAKAALEALVLAGPLTLKRLGTQDRDRYGRVLAFVYPAGATASVQETLLAQGHARVSARIGDKACADTLLTSERTARAARLGLWTDPNFAPVAADHLAQLAAERGHFALVEGKVVSVHESGATIYLNFGRRWTEDFSVVIPSRLNRTFAAAGLAPKSLEGKRVRVRGFIEQRNGPVIEAAAPEQIEAAD
jgi:endonuclease YncB( thermonuclease family)